MTLSISATRTLLAASLATGLAFLSGCGVGTVANADNTDTSVGKLAGVIHGGPNPIVGARVVIYATTSSGYGVGAQLQEANQQGASAGQDTDVNGGFQFAGGYNCPAGQYAYVAVYGGKTGSNAVNPNSILMAALGPCSSLYSGTTYLGNLIEINELTTIAAAYSLSNFMTVTGNSATGFTVGVGAPSTNNATAGCVSNSYYGTGTCPTTVSPGLRDAFANAANLISYYGFSPNATTANGATVPVQLLNTMGNSLQDCVNSAGGGTDGTGVGTSTPTANDGTACGQLFSFTSYTTTAAIGPNTGTTTNLYPTNTLSAMQNLAKRPSGASTTWNAGCTATGTVNSSVQCIYNMSSAFPFYNTAMTAAPPDYLLAISYPKGAFGGTTTSTTCNTSSLSSTSLLYPFWLATDIDDNIVVLNTDSSSTYCYNVLTFSNSGTPIGSSAIFNNTTGTTSLGLKWISTDAFGHAIVPAGAANSVQIYAAGASDSTIAQAASVAVTAGGSGQPVYAAVENNGDIYLGGQGSASNFQVLTAGTQSHTAPTYTDAIVGTTPNALTSKLFQVAIDINGNVWANNSSSSTVANYSYAPGAAGYVKTNGVGSSSSGSGNSPDIYGNEWLVLKDATNAATDIYKTGYTNPPASGTITPEVQAATISPNASAQTTVAMDGNDVLWWSDTGAGSTSTTPVTSGYLRGYDTINNYSFPALYGCKFQSGQTLCGSQGSSNSNTPYPLYATRGIAVDAAGSIWVANGTQGQVNQIIGLAAPTLPLFIHNGTSLKP